MNREIITSNDPKSPISEIFRTLRTNLQYMKRSDKSQSILITSTVQEEGKSFVASNLAVTFAQAGKNTIIVDADMRKPRQHKKFSVQMYPGLSNFLSGIDIDRLKRELHFEDCIYQTEVENLWIMPSGNIPPNPSELLQSTRFYDLMKILESRFDVIIFDGAPCMAVTDSIIISRLATHTVLVCSQNSTKIDELKDVKRMIQQVGGNIAGVVLNKVKVSKKKLENSYYASYNNLVTPNKSKNDKNEFLGSKSSHKNATIKYNNVWENERKNEYSSTNKNVDRKTDFSSTKNDEEINNKKEKTDEKDSKTKEDLEKKKDNAKNKNDSVKENKKEEAPDKLSEILKQINELKENSKNNY